jgi:hypothetical protein
MTSLASATDIHPIKSSSLPFKLAIALTLAGRTGLADRREPYRADGSSLYLLAHEFRCCNRRLQRQP